MDQVQAAGHQKTLSETKKVHDTLFLSCSSTLSFLQELFVLKAKVKAINKDLKDAVARGNKDEARTLEMELAQAEDAEGVFLCMA